MIELLQDYGAYWMCFLVLTVGLYGMLLKRNYVKKVMGLTIFQAAIILFFVISSYKDAGTVPVIDPEMGAENADLYMSPLPHTLMLTAIVVGVATVGMALSLLIRIYQGFGTLDEGPLQEKMKS